MGAPAREGLLDDRWGWETMLETRTTASTRAR